jgi:hypothetical protein
MLGDVIMTLVNGIDLDLLIEDLAYTKRRVTQLEDNQKTIIKFLMARFSQKANKIKRLLGDPKESKKMKVTVFGQDIDKDLTTDEAILQCMLSVSVEEDPILKKVKVQANKNQPIPQMIYRR